MKQKFKSAATGGRFKQRGQGLRAAEERIKEQRRTEIDAIKLAQLQHKEISSNFISGIGNAQQFELGVLDEKQKLENKVRQHKYDALSKLAETDVKRLEDEAKAKQKTADWWADFAPKFAKNLGTLATGTLQFADAYRGQKQWEALKASGILDEITDQKEEVNNTIFSKITKDGHSGDPDENNTLHRKTWKVSTHWASKRLAQWYKENKALIRSDVIASWEAMGGQARYGESNALEIQKFNAHQLLTQLGISPTSQGGREILEMSTQLGREDQKTFANIRKSEETATDIRQQLNTLKSLEVGTDEFKIAFDELVNLHKHGYFKTDKGISTPYDNPRSIADGLELAYTAYIDANLKNLTTEKQVNDLLRTIIPDTHEEHVAFSDKHPVRAERILEYWGKKNRQRIQLKNNARSAEGLAEADKIETEINDRPWFEKGMSDSEEEAAYSQWRADTIKAISLNKKFTDDTRAIAYGHVDFDPANHKIAGVYSNIRTELNSGNLKRAVKLFNSLTTAKQEAIKAEIELFQDIENSGISDPESNTTGLAAVHAINERLIKEVQHETIWGTKGKLSRSALETLDIMNKRWIGQFKLHKDKGGATAVALANDWMKAEWEKGKGNEDHWLYREDSLTKGKPVTFPNRLDGNDLALARNKAITNIEEAKEGNMVYTKETLITLIKNVNNHHLIPGFNGDLIELLGKDEFISKKELNTIVLQIQNIQKGNTSLKAGDIQLPENVETFLEHYTYQEYDPEKKKMVPRKYTKKGLIKEIFGKHNVDIEILEGSDAATAIKNDQDVVTKRNEPAFNYYNASKAQTGKIPIKKHVRQYLETATDYPEQALLNTFSASTGIEWEWNSETGRYAFSDTEGYLHNGGLDLPLNITPTELMQSLGFSALLEDKIKLGKRSITNWGGY